MAGRSSPIQITDDLIRDLDSDLDVFRDRSRYANFPRRSKASPGKKGGEIGFLNRFIPDLDGVSGEDPVSNTEVLIKTKSYHSTPSVRFWWPGEEIFKRCELADILFLLTYYDSGEIVGRRTMMSQTKYVHDNKHVTMRAWDCSPYQYDLLHRLREFYPVSPDLGEWYNLQKDMASYRTYSFVSDFWLPFFHSTTGMANEYIPYSESETSKYQYDRTDNPPSGYQSLTGYLKQFIRGQYGQQFSPDDRIGQFYQDLFDSNMEFNTSNSPDRLSKPSDLRPDGGEGPPPETEETNFGMVHIVVSNRGMPDQDGGHKVDLGDDSIYEI